MTKKIEFTVNTNELLNFAKTVKSDDLTVLFERQDDKTVRIRVNENNVSSILLANTYEILDENSFSTVLKNFFSIVLKEEHASSIIKFMKVLNKNKSVKFTFDDEKLNINENGVNMDFKIDENNGCIAQNGELLYSFKADTKRVIRALKNCKPFQMKGEEGRRAALNNILLQVNDKGFKLVALDGFKLLAENIEAEITKNGEFNEDHYKHRILLENEMIDRLKKLKSEKMNFRIYENVIEVFDGDSLILVQQMVNEEFFQYETLLKTEDGKQVLASQVEEVEQYLKTVIKMEDKNPLVKFSSSKKGFVGESGKMKVKKEFENKEFRKDYIIGFNGKYLLDAISTFDGEGFEIYNEDRVKQVIMFNEERTALVLPVRLDKYE